MADIYRRDGTPYPAGDKGFYEWGIDFADPAKKRVALDKLSNGVEVSTVWLGLDHGLGLSKRPLIFETMLFVAQRKVIDALGTRMVFNRESIGEQWRYSTEEEALRGHKMMVKKWSKYKSADQVLGRVHKKS